MSGTKKKLPFGEKCPISDEFIQVECKYKIKTVYLELHSFLPKKPKVLERVHMKMLNESKKSQEDKLNVMILGIDTLSRLNFHRTMKKSSKTVEKLGGIEFHGYNKVGKL